MMPSWCSEVPRFVCLLIVVSTLALPAWSHPDLLLQIEELDRTLASRPADAELLARRGDLHRRDGNYAAATQDLAAARSAQPDYPLLDFYQGSLLLDAGQPAQAEERLSHYLQNYPEHASARILRAHARLALGQADQAAQDYAAAIQSTAIQSADQASPALYRDWSLALVAAGQEQWNAAIKAVDAGLERFPQDVSLLALGTDIALAEGQPGAATAYVNRLPSTITRLDPWSARLELADCLAQAERGNEQPECQRTAIRYLREQAGPNLGSE